MDEGPSSPPQTQYDALRDGGFEHLDHEAEDDKRATQRLQRFRPNLLGDNAVADNAILESIECINFMCHQRLHCELGPLLNFIVGENGSGKSAILTAITLCLGGKASSTNRGGSLKSFIKEGCDQARLVVKIKNMGHDAYKPDIYGDSIIVERHFNKKGTSGFRVKSATGQTITTKKQEIEEIVEYYALQVDNPLNVLSQDNARQFLNASTKAQKYQFFVDGVQLQQLDNDYRLINENLDGMVAKVPDQEARVKQAETTLNEAMRKKEAIQGNHAIRVKHRVLRNQLVWAQVVEEEREIATREATLAEAVAKVAELERNVEEKSEELRAADEKIERIEQAIIDLKADQGTTEEQAQEAKHAFDSMHEQVQLLLVEEREANQNLKNASDQVAMIKKKIAQEQQRLEDANGQAHSEKLHELEEAKKKVETIAKAIDQNKADEPRIVELQTNAKKKLAEVGEDVIRKQTEITHVERKITDLERNAGSLYDGYEAKVPELIRMIEKERGFEHKPIGPLGAHIQLLQPQWSAVLEATIGKNLNAFLVATKNDSKLLYSMMSRLNIRDCPVLLSNNRKPIPLEKLKDNKPEGFVTILDVLKFDDDLVRDQLIMNHTIEKTVLMEQRTEAEKTMFDGPPPRNVKAIICFRTGDRGPGLRLTENNGTIGTSPVNIKNSRTRIKINTGSEIAFLKQQHHQLEVEYRAIDAERRLLNQEAQRCESEVKRHKNERNSLMTQSRKARLEVEQVEQDLDKFDGVDGRLQGLQEQLAEHEADTNHHGMQFGALGLRKTQQNKELEALHRRKKEASAQLEDSKARLEKAENKLVRAKQARRIVLEEKAGAIALVDFANTHREAMEGRLDRQRTRTAQFEGKAKEISPIRVEIPEGETHKSLEKQYQVLGVRIQQEEKRHGMTENEINQKVIEATEARDREAGILRSILQVNQGLKQTLRIRLDKWRMFQRHITAQSRCNFQYLLSERGFRGKLLFDHRRRFLDLQVEPDKTKKEPGGRSTKTLSGGEKSFSSICLLLSIWEAMGSPLRCLDEFDVFMDNVNRAISTNMLVGCLFKAPVFSTYLLTFCLQITAARRSVNRQYIFITPNAIEGRNQLDEDVKIIRYVTFRPTF